jgi:hypothetical protein
VTNLAVGDIITTTGATTNASGNVTSIAGLIATVNVTIAGSGTATGAIANSFASAINFNNVVDFEQSQDDALLNNTGGIWGPSGTVINNWESYSAVVHETLSEDQSYMGLFGGSGPIFMPMQNGSGGGYFDAGSGTVLRATVASTGSVANNSYLYSTFARYPTSPFASFSQNGLVAASGAANYTGFTSSAAQFNVGSYTPGSQFFDGPVGEIVIYTSNHTDAEIQRIQSYMALKYGSSLDQSSPYDYIASNGTTKMWNSSIVQDTYKYDIAGIGRDDASGLTQVKSKSGNVDEIWTIGTTSATIPTDLTFVSWANDNGAGTFTSAAAPAGGYQILTRKWMLQKTGEVGNLTLQVDVADTDLNIPTFSTANGLYLVIDTDADTNLSDETVAGGGMIRMYDDGTNGDTIPSDNVWTINNIDFATVTAGKLFTIAQKIVGPGGVTSGLIAWFDVGDFNADGIANNSADGTTLTSGWKDRSSSAYSSTSGGGAFTLESDATNLANF